MELPKPPDGCYWNVREGRSLTWLELVKVDREDYHDVLSETPVFMGEYPDMVIRDAEILLRVLRDGPLADKGITGYKYLGKEY